jgi:hypothetical protein
MYCTFLAGSCGTRFNEFESGSSSSSESGYRSGSGFFISKIAIYLSPGLHKARPRYRRSLQLSKENISTSKFLFFYLLFMFVGPVEPDPDCESGYGSRDPIEFGTNPDPQH